MRRGQVFFKILNAIAGIACIFIGIFLPQIDVLHVLQSAGEDAYRLIQAHWIAVGGVSLLVARSNRNSQRGSSLLLVWVILNCWIGGKALLEMQSAFSWVLVFPVVSGLNFFQLLAQDHNVADADQSQDLESQIPSDGISVPSDFYEIRATSVADATRGLFALVYTVVFQFLLLVGFFFYGTLINLVIFEGSSVDLSSIPGALGGLFFKISYLPAIIIVVYSIVILVQVVLENSAIRRGSSGPEDANRALSDEERRYIESHIQKIGSYRSAVKYPWYYGWFYWPSIAVMIGLFIGFPCLVLAFQVMFFDPVLLAGISDEKVLTSLGPALIGGSVFSFLFGAALYWSALQWFGRRNRRFGEYLHSDWGWHSMDHGTRLLEAYKKIFTRFVRLRRYMPNKPIEPSKFLYDAFNEFSGLVFSTTIVLAVATVIFTALDANWRRVSHVDGLHYSPYFDFRSYDLTLDDVVSIELRCYLYGENDDGERRPGLGYDLLYTNGLRAYHQLHDVDVAQLEKFEALDLNLNQRKIPIIHAKQAGPIFLRLFDGYRTDCAKVVIPKLDAEFRDRLAALIQAAPPPQIPPQN